MSDTQVVPYQASDVPDCMPAVSIPQLLQRRQMFVEFVGKLMQQGEDYGVIPGAKKPTLLKPGAEKLCNFFGLVPEFDVVEKVEDWSGDQHGGEPLFSYTYKCRLIKRSQIVGSGDGHCNSREVKYRYRQGERICPACGKPAIIKGKEQYGGGWVCFKKKDGCGSTWKDGAVEIEGQQVGRVVNPDVCDLVNTIIKMAQKRALVAAVLVATSASEFYTQDVEDLMVPVNAAATIAASTPEATQEPLPKPDGSAKITNDQASDLWAAVNGDKRRMDATLKVFGFSKITDIPRSKYVEFSRVLSGEAEHVAQGTLV